MHSTRSRDNVVASVLNANWSHLLSTSKKTVSPSIYNKHTRVRTHDPFRNSINCASTRRTIRLLNNPGPGGDRPCCWTPIWSVSSSLTGVSLGPLICPSPITASRGRGRIKRIASCVSLRSTVAGSLSGTQSFKRFLETAWERVRQLFTCPLSRQFRCCRNSVVAESRQKHGTRQDRR
jgi:hypothetical protein